MCLEYYPECGDGGWTRHAARSLEIAHGYAPALLR